MEARASAPRTPDTGRYDPWPVDPATEAALRALARAEREDQDSGRFPLSEEYLAAIRAVEARLENQDGSDKIWNWPAYEFCRRHFLEFEPT